MSSRISKQDLLPLFLLDCCCGREVEVEVEVEVQGSLNLGNSLTQ